MKKLISKILIVAVIASLCTFNAFADAGDSIVIEAESNAVTVDSKSTRDDSSKSGGVRASSASTGAWTWSFTPDKTGYYEVEVCGGYPVAGCKSRLMVDNTLIGEFTLEELSTPTGSYNDIAFPITKCGGAVKLTAGVNYGFKLTALYDYPALNPAHFDYFRINYYEEPQDDIVIEADAYVNKSGAGDKFSQGDNYYGMKGYALKIQAGEWYEYTFETQRSGYYRVLGDLCMSYTASPIDVTVDNETKSKTFDNDIPISYTSYNYRYADLGWFYIDKGEHTLRIANGNTSPAGTTGTNLAYRGFKIVSPNIVLSDASQRQSPFIIQSLVAGTYKAEIDVTDWYAGQIYFYNNQLPVTTWHAKGLGQIDQLAVIIAVYDGNKLEKAYYNANVVDTTNVSNANLKDYKITIENIEVADGQYAKIFILDNGNLTPLADYNNY